ncbi:MAG: PIN domain-containing protein [Myxococcales bacterium]|nr:PIN domain-containing protein [Myxococcales bacterium]
MILDTNAVSALADGNAGLEAAAHDVIRFSIPVIVLGEFSFGIRRSRRRVRYEDWLDRLMEASIVLDVDAGTAERYAALREILRRRGRPIPSNDAWIAALALQHELPVLSRDSHFDEVDGVRRVGWED